MGPLPDPGPCDEECGCVDDIEPSDGTFRGWENVGWIDEAHEWRVDTAVPSVVDFIRDRMEIPLFPWQASVVESLFKPQEKSFDWEPYATKWLREWDADYPRIRPLDRFTLELPTTVVTLQTMHIAIGFHDEDGEPTNIGLSTCSCGYVHPWIRATQ
jgi:hypothetical protein